MITLAGIFVIMMRTQISLSAEEYLSAKREAKRLRISLAEFLRRALRKDLPINRDKPWMRFCGFVATGNAISSQTIDEIVYGVKD